MINNIRACDDDDQQQHSCLIHHPGIDLSRQGSTIYVLMSFVSWRCNLCHHTTNLFVNFPKYLEKY